MNQVAPRLPGAEHLTGVSVEPTESGTTSRARLVLEWDEPGHPASVFVKQPADGVGARWFGTLVGLGATEARFYADIRSSCDLPAPVCFVAEARRFGRFTVALEDLAAAGATFPTVADGASVDQAAAVVAALATVHATLWASSRFETDLAWVRRPSHGGLRRRIERAMLRTAVRTARKRFPDELRGDIGTLLAEAERSDRVLDGLRDRAPVTLLHGDTHLGNTYFLPDGTAGLFDWQVLQRGPGIRDVAYFLALSLPRAEREAAEVDLVAGYRSALVAADVSPPPPDDLWDQYRLYAVDPLRSAVFTAAMGNRLQPERQWRTGLERAIAAATHLDTLGAMRAALAASA